jgi:hypothetical protein
MIFLNLTFFSVTAVIVAFFIVKMTHAGWKNVTRNFNLLKFLLLE